MSQPQAALRGVCLFQPLPSWPQFQTAVTGTQRTYLCALAKRFFSCFSQSPNLQWSSWGVTQIHYRCSEPGMHHLCCNVQHQSKMTFLNARRKNREVWAVEIVREVLRFKIKELKKHARLKQSQHIWYKKNLRWTTLGSQVFALGFSVLNQNVKNTFYVCRYTAVTAITIQLWTTSKVFRSLAKCVQKIQHSGVALTALSC